MTRKKIYFDGATKLRERLMNVGIFGLGTRTGATLLTPGTSSGTCQAFFGTLALNYSMSTTLACLFLFLQPLLECLLIALSSGKNDMRQNTS